MRAHAHAHDNADIPAKRRRRRAKRKLITRTTPPPPPPVPPAPPTNPDLHYEAGWTDRRVLQLERCFHKHATLIEAAQCAMANGCGCYVFAVEKYKERELNEAEDAIVNAYRFRK
jgi:hypothetical protein